MAACPEQVAFPVKQVQDGECEQSFDLDQEKEHMRRVVNAFLYYRWGNKYVGHFVSQ